MKHLQGKKILMIIAKEKFRDEEYSVPREALETVGAAVTVASSSLAVAEGMLGMKVKPDVLIGSVKAEDYDGIVFVGGGGAKEYFDSPVAHKLAHHLELAVSKPLSLVKRVRHAGAIFLGTHTPEAIGDYMAGPNHILPTAGTARFSSPLGVEDFIKRTNVMRFTQSALRRFKKDVKGFSEWEGLEGHYLSVQKRMEKR